MNEKLGDHPLTDFLAHGRHPFPRDIERMICAIHRVDPSALDDVAPKTFYWAMRRGLFLVDRIQLAVQAHETFEQVMPGRGYVLRPGMPRRDRQVTIALLQTMISRLGEFDAREFDVVFVDECHRSVFGRWRPCVERFDATRIGLTATPSYHSKELFGPATYRYTLRRGIEEGYLSPYRIYRAMTLITKGGVRVNGTNYGPQELERAITVPDRNRTMVEKVERIAIAGKVLVYAITKRHAAEIARYFNALRPSLGGRYAEAITTDSEDPQDAIRRFKREEYPRSQSPSTSLGFVPEGGAARARSRLVTPGSCVGLQVRASSGGPPGACRS